LAICGVPLFSGWYSKDALLAQALGFSLQQSELGHNEHVLLFLLPLLTAGLTAFYMFRMWLMTFPGRPRDPPLYGNAPHAPRVMTARLIILAVFSLAVAWGSPLWSAEESYLGGHEGALRASQPAAVAAGFAEEEKLAAAKHSLAEALAMGMGGLGVVFAFLLY